MAPKYRQNMAELRATQKATCKFVFARSIFVLKAHILNVNCMCPDEVN
jgi:hypothetical protein